MTRLYEIKWSAFGVLEDVEAENEEEALEILEDELFGLDRDGLDYEIVEV